MAREFHWRDDIYFRATDEGNVDVFRRPKRVAYWTQEKGFHDPEEPLFTVDWASWTSIVHFIAGTTHELSGKCTQILDNPENRSSGDPLASCDTHPTGEDAKQASCASMSGAVPKGNAQTPSRPKKGMSGE